MSTTAKGKRSKDSAGLSSQDHSPANTARSDEALMEAFREGDARAFEELVRRHQRGVFSFLLRSVGVRARAEELLQEVFLRVVRSKERYRRTAKFTTWLYTIARNLCVDESRRARFRRTQALETTRRGEGRSILERTADATPGPDRQAEGPRIQSRLRDALDALPRDQKEVFLLRFASDLSFKEIAATVGAPENTVKSRMRYALEKLRSELADYREDPGEGGAK